MTVPTYFGKKLREAREKAGLSLRGLSEELGISHVFIGEVERGVKARIAEEHWDKLVKVLAVKKKDLKDWAERIEKLELDLRGLSDQAWSFKLARAIRNKVELTSDQKQKILNIVGES